MNTLFLSQTSSSSYVPCFSSCHLGAPDSPTSHLSPSRPAHLFIPTTFTRIWTFVFCCLDKCNSHLMTCLSRMQPTQLCKIKTSLLTLWLSVKLDWLPTVYRIKSQSFVLTNTAWYLFDIISTLISPKALNFIDPILVSFSCIFCLFLNLCHSPVTEAENLDVFPGYTFNPYPSKRLSFDHPWNSVGLICFLSQLYSLFFITCSIPYYTLQYVPRVLSATRGLLACCFTPSVHIAAFIF